jgi:hypothetical protein
MAAETVLIEERALCIEYNRCEGLTSAALSNRSLARSQQDKCGCAQNRDVP